ncbi:FHA domain-containing protein [Hydrogenispora ethanolica]|jgi:hypothetical protein|uniref:FHA domain-containing protein n=1 Tax=Hydrogenispora ethanolica TaxID=1082276 RepID=A0A4R1RU16_HYDET|nr:trypsin-like peptidase domain-containing protein [Hydrogenispora ethanolica]TCL69946.1 FHA domain-containing protein [Hydrogenispora ethanolica]
MRKEIGRGLMMAWAIFFWLAPAAAAPDLSDVARGVLRLVCFAPRSTFSGSGFAIGKTSRIRYVVTNYHVVSSAPDRVMVCCSGSKMVRTKVIGAYPSIDLALLELEQPLAGIQPLTLSSRSRVKLGQKVFAMGYPEAADELSGGMAFSRPEDVTVTDGIISRITQRDGVRYYQTNADINHGNSGGPLVMESGEVIGINALSMGDLKAQGINGAIQVDELLPELVKLGIPFRTDVLLPARGRNVPAIADAAPNRQWGGAGPVFFGVAGLLVLVLLSGLFWLWRDGRRKRQVAAAAPEQTRLLRVAVHPILRACGGSRSGQAMSLMPGEWILLGRDPGLCQLVFPAKDAEISRKHCRVGYDAETDRFRLVDCGSANGTFLASGERLIPEREYVLRAGERFYLSKEDYGFIVEIGARR